MDIHDFMTEFEEGWSRPRGGQAFLDHFLQFMSDETRMVQPMTPTAVGRQEFAEMFGGTFELIPDLHAEVHGYTAEGDEVGHVDFDLIGTIGRREFRLTCCDRITVRDDKVVERIAYFDPTPMVFALLRSPRSWPKAIRLMSRRSSGRSRPSAPSAKPTPLAKEVS
jgi:ketosteroid isomerase-like protein